MVSPAVIPADAAAENPAMPAGGGLRRRDSWAIASFPSPGHTARLGGYCPQIMWRRLLVVGGAAATLVVACGDDGESGAGVTISRAQFEQDDLVWPFAVDEAVLRCEQSAVIVTIEGTDYAANGVALSRDFPNVVAVQLDDEELAGQLSEESDVEPKVSLSDVTQTGLDMCD